ncbi:hypothetical protein, partial [Micromonospora carbonacea]|uniref:hypothetical protein n=1 Tax=Micromonospora carbonacea TaxID=47853 RepID=UPI0033EBB7EB
MSASAGPPAAGASPGHGGAVVTAPGAPAGVGTAGDAPAERAAGTVDGPDLRLAGLAVAAWLAALVSLHLSARAA